MHVDEVTDDILLLIDMLLSLRCCCFCDDRMLWSHLLLRFSDDDGKLQSFDPGRHWRCEMWAAGLIL